MSDRIFTTAAGDRIVLDDDATDMLLGPEGEALLQRKADRAQFQAECDAELATRHQEDCLTEWQERRALEES